VDDEPRVDVGLEEVGVYRAQDWAEVHWLFYREGWSKTGIAEKLGMSRNTVARLLELEEPPISRRPRRGSKLHPYRGDLEDVG